jgi:hypothetical protein
VPVTVGAPTFARLLLTVPPVPCPCVVRVESPTSTIVRTTTVELAGVPVQPVSPPLGPAKASNLKVSSTVVGAADSWPASWSGAFGGRANRRLRVVLTNNGAVPITGVSVTAYVGRDRSSGHPVASRHAGALAPHASETIEMPFALGAPAWGEYQVFGHVYGLDRPASFATTTESSPWAWQIVIPLVLLLVARWLRRRERLRSRSAVAVVHPAMSIPTVAPGVTSAVVRPVAAAAPEVDLPTPAPIPVRIAPGAAAAREDTDVLVPVVDLRPLSQRSPDVVERDEERSRGPAYVPDDERAPAATPARQVEHVP